MIQYGMVDKATKKEKFSSGKKLLAGLLISVALLGMTFEARANSQAQEIIENINEAEKKVMN